ncbi:MAG: DUF3179 domain-containing (seleno)protein [Pseudomonadota bacterium]
MTLFFVVFFVLVLAELTKGLSANGTPPVLQKFDWQIDLAHFMWTHIQTIRVVLVFLLVVLFFAMTGDQQIRVVPGSILLGMAWGGIYWLFNHYWVGRVKFKPLPNPSFAQAADSSVDPAVAVVGVTANGAAKAYPTSMLFYHHQVPDEIGGQPIWATYCGLCRSGRIYDRTVDGQTLDFQLVGAITFNAVFKDFQTNSWWRQETGEAVKGPQSGKALSDLPFQQMSLANWLEMHPDSDILQYDPDFKMQYVMRDRIMNYEASLPGWHMQETPPLVVGVEVGDAARAYDWNQLQRRRMVMDELGSTPLLVVSAADETFAAVYDRRVGGDTLNFEFADEVLTDTSSGSKWDQFGRCVEGQLAGTQLTALQSYQQYVRAWVSFHADTTFYDFNS